MRNNKYLFIFTLLYFLLGFVNIHLALLGVFCMLIPFILLLRDRKKPGVQAIARELLFILHSVSTTKGKLVIYLCFL